MENNSIFWKEGFEGKAKAGIIFRTFDLNKFMSEIEQKNAEVVGVKFEGNNCELILNAEK
tara:strand:+ start:324 stop:503 length:180 start_codon:yes stop_codon:yes gene_type:complete